MFVAKSGTASLDHFGKKAGGRTDKMACPSRTRTDAGSPGCLDKIYVGLDKATCPGEKLWMGPHASLCSESNFQIWLDPSCSHVGQKWAVLVSNIGHLPVVVKLVGSYQTRSPHELQVESDSIRAIRTANRISPLQAHREEYSDYTPGRR